MNKKGLEGGGGGDKGYFVVNVNVGKTLLDAEMVAITSSQKDIFLHFLKMYRIHSTVYHK
jgi:hypothetical protein